MIQLTSTHSDEELEQFGKNLRIGLKTGVRDGLHEIGMFLVGKIKDEIEKKSPGSKKGIRRGKKVWISPRGKSPNSDTGELMGSIAYSLINNNQSVFVGSTVFNKAEVLEDENRLNRPFIKPTIMENEKKLGDLMMKNIVRHGKQMNRSRDRARRKAGGS